MSENPSGKRNEKARNSYSLTLRNPAIEIGSFSASEAQVGNRKSGSAVAWFMSEYIAGPLFLALTWVYTYLAPSSVSSLDDVWDFNRRVFKRGMDIVGATVGLIICAPVFLLLPIVIKLDSRGSVFYSQVRVGHDRRRSSRRAYNLSSNTERRRRDRRRDNASGRLFNVYKFRTMVSDAEVQTGPVWATHDDPRITRIGRLLRRSRLDELPQLLNVLKGEMALVGPRPERPVFVSQLSKQLPGYERRLSIRPGLTGLAQVENGYDVSVNSVATKLKTDLRYIDTWTVTADFKILLRTVWVVCTGRGAN